MRAQSQPPPSIISPKNPQCIQKQTNQIATLLLKKCTSCRTNHPVCGPRDAKSIQKKRGEHFLKASRDIIRTQRGICSGLTRLIYSILQTPHKPHHNITQKLTPTLHHTVQKEKLKSCQISDFHFSQKKQ